MINSSRNILYRQGDNILMSVPIIASSCGGEEEVYIVSENKENYKIRVLTSDYLANGGDKMNFFNNKNQLKVGLKIRDAIINYCRSEKTISSKLNKKPWEIILDHFTSSEDDEFLMHTFENYTHNSLDVIAEMLESEYTICGVGDAGAHVATICDASYPTFMVPFWSRDRKRGKLLNLEYLVSKQTLKTAQTYGLLDRGALIEGMRADINIIDYDNIGLTKPCLSYDLPAGGKRLIQKSKGYNHTCLLYTSPSPRD